MLLTTFAASTNPSAVTTALIAVGSAVIGGVLTAVAQVVVESRRAAHERALESEKATREDGTRSDEEAALTRGAARLLSDHFQRRCSLYQTTIDQGKYWGQSYELPPLMSDFDRRILARRLSATQWRTIANAEMVIATLDATRGFLDRDDEWFDFTETDPFHLRTVLTAAVIAMSQAIEALKTVSD